jgi:putative endonuclease
VSSKIKRGQEGEEQAARYLESQGYQVVARNYRYKRAEIDLIVRQDNWLVFVEVKTRSSTAFGHPEEFVDAKKRVNILQAAAHYLEETSWQGHVRYDVVAVLLTPTLAIEHLPDAFY